MNYLKAFLIYYFALVRVYSAETEDHYFVTLNDSAPLINEVICSRLNHLANYYNGKYSNGEKPRRDVIILGTGLIKKNITSLDELKADIVWKSRNGLAHGLPEASYKESEEGWVKAESVEVFQRIPEILASKSFSEPCFLLKNDYQDNIFSELSKIRNFLILNEIPILSDLGAKGIQDVFKIGDAFISTDKLNHFLNEGTTYFYDSWNEDSYDYKKGEKSSINSELTYFGHKSSGVFSFADLEANRRGAEFLYSLVFGKNPTFSINEIGEDKYEVKLNSCPDIKDFFSLQMNEVFNPNNYLTSMSQQMAEGITKKIEKRAKVLSVNIEDDFPYCANILIASKKEKEILDNIKESGSESEIEKITSMWALCPEKLSFHDLINVNKSLIDEGNLDKTLKILEIRKKVSEQFIKKRLKTDDTQHIY